jgi:serine/threonine protein kinase
MAALGKGAGASRPTQRGAMSARPASSASARKITVDPLLLHGYQTISPIANGAFSQIVRARHLSTQQEVAVKTFQKARYLQPGNEHLAKAMVNELDVLKRLQASRHAHIANILEVTEDPINIRAILEYCGGGSLKKLMERIGAGSNMSRAFGLDTKLCNTVGFQLISALTFIHERGIVHRDVKPENVLFTDLEHKAVKLCDFGFAVACGSKRVRTVCGTPQYMAPEIAGASLARREPYHGWAVDMWAFGAMLFEMLEGKPAFRGSSMEQLNIRIVRASHESFTSASAAPARNLIKRCFELDAASRLTGQAAVEHAWFAQRRRESQEASVPAMVEAPVEVPAAVQ